MINLYTSDRAFGLPSPSPFCTKLELYLRATGIEYKTGSFNPMKAPKGKMPYFENNGEMVADSSLVIEYLCKKFGDKLDADLTPDQLAIGRLVKRTLEEGTYFSLLHLRWGIESNWRPYKKIIFASMPGPMKLFMPRLIRRNLLKGVKAQGTGRHQNSEITEMALRDFQAVAAILGNKQYLLGDKFTSYDCTVYAFFAGSLRAPYSSPAKTFLQNCQPAVDYCRRVEEAYLQDIAT